MLKNQMLPTAHLSFSFETHKYSIESQVEV